MKRTLSTLVIALFGASALSKDCNSTITPPPVTNCYVGGCSGQLCTNESGALSTCEWRDEYACYKDATCELQRNGECGWTRTRELRQCLRNPPVEPGPCYVGGCSGQLCTEDPEAISTCEWRNEYMCYESAACERQRNGQCGWTSTHELRECLENPPLPSEPEPLPPADYCYVTGCSGQICSSEREGMVTTCEWRPEYTCYQAAACERQRNGDCGWTRTSELRECLANPPLEPELPVPEPDQCFVGGCSGQLCTDDPNAISTCEWTSAYECYRTATCERQRNGDCGWTRTSELRECLANPPPLD